MSSEAIDVAVGKESTITMRVLVDRSVTELYGMGGRMSVTSRVYPVKADSMGASVVLDIPSGVAVPRVDAEVWEVGSAHIQ